MPQRTQWTGTADGVLDARLDGAADAIVEGTVAGAVNEQAILEAVKRMELMAEVDAGLFRRACRGDRDAFWQLVLPFRGLIYSVALGMLNDPEHARDQLHDALIQAFRSLSNLRDHRRLASWLYSLTRNRVIDQMRREKRLRTALNNSGSVLTHVVPMAEIMEREQWLSRMEEALGQLPEPFRVVLGMKYMNDYSCREMADILDISVPAVKSRLFEARKLLRKKTEALAVSEASRKSLTASLSGGAVAVEPLTVETPEAIRKEQGHEMR